MPKRGFLSPSLNFLKHWTVNYFQFLNISSLVLVTPFPIDFLHLWWFFLELALLTLHLFQDNDYFSLAPLVVRTRNMVKQMVFFKLYIRISPVFSSSLTPSTYWNGWGVAPEWAPGTGGSKLFFTLFWGEKSVENYRLWPRLLNVTYQTCHCLVPTNLSNLPHLAFAFYVLEILSYTFLYIICSFMPPGLAVFFPSFMYLDLFSL